MVAEPGRREARAPEGSAVETGARALAAAGPRLAAAGSLDEALATVTDAVARATSAQVVVARTLDGASDSLPAGAVYAASSALAAELEGSRFPASELAPDEVTGVAELPAPVRRAARTLRAAGVLQIPVRDGGRPLASLELLRTSRPFDDEERALARIAAQQVALAVRAFAASGRADGAPLRRTGALDAAGAALEAGADDARSAERLVALAADVSGAPGVLLWRADDDALSLAASYGLTHDSDAYAAAEDEALRSLAERRSPVVVPAGTNLLVTLPLGEPPLGALQLIFALEAPPPGELLTRLGAFAVRAAHALRASERRRLLTAELERSRALLAVVGQAIAQLSLAHTLETAIDRVAELLDSDRLAVYLVEEERDRLVPAAGRGLAGPHARVAERLLTAALGGARGRGILVVEDAARDPRLAEAREAVSEAGIEAAIAIPLTVQQDVIGLLAVYPPPGRTLTPNESALVIALAAQLAVAVQNARLHEQVKQRDEERREALAAEQHAVRQLTSLYEVSRSFAQSLSLDATVDAVARAIVELLEADAAVIRMPDARAELLVARALHVAEPAAAEAVRTVLSRPQPLAKLPGRRLFRMGRPLVLDAESAARLGASYELLVPFLEKGSTAAVVPISTATELLGTLTVLSLNPARPLDDEKVEAAVTLARQAALAIDNARLYQQQKEFLETMQRSLLPRARPELPGLELGDVYASSARVDVGGDIYDFMTLPDGRLAVVLGDVTGKGIDAAADMAMAKFVFRSLARDHPEPADFLAAANEVVVEEIGSGKFITMTYLTIDPDRGELRCACAGHPPPRLLEADGSVGPLAVGGLALGIESGQVYDAIDATLAAGAAVVLYTDGVVEARRGGELYGEERLDALLAARSRLPARELALAVLADCRAFGGGELADDCAVVVIRRTA